MKNKSFIVYKNEKYYLTQRQYNFVLNLMDGKSEVNAYVQAGYSEKAAQGGANKLAKNDEVQRLLGVLREEATTEAVMTKEEVLIRLSMIASGKAVEKDAVIIKRAEFVDNEDDLAYNEWLSAEHDMSEWSDEQIERFKKYQKRNDKRIRKTLVYNESIVNIERPPKISDQRAALDSLGKHYKLFTDKHEIMDVTPIFVDDVPLDDED